MASCERNTPPLSLTSTSGTPYLRIAAYSTARYASVSCWRESQNGSAKIFEDTDAVDHASTELIHVQVPNVRGPVLMAPLGLERHLFFRATTLHRHLQVIELPIEREDASTSTRREVDAKLQEGGMNPVSSQFRVFLELLHLVHGSQIDLAHRGFGGVWFVLQPGKLLFYPSLKNSVNGLSTHLKIPGDAFRIPPFRMEPNNHPPSLHRVIRLGEAWEAASGT